jgi:transcription elongation factor Elf1
MISEIPLTCPHCRKTTVKSVDWVQHNTFFTCEACGASAMIDKDLAAELLAKLELQQRH